MSGQEGGTSDNLAKLRAKASDDPIASFLEMRLLELSEGYAKVRMKLKPISSEVRSATSPPSPV